VFLAGRCKRFEAMIPLTWHEEVITCDDHCFFIVGAKTERDWHSRFLTRLVIETVGTLEPRANITAEEALVLLGNSLLYSLGVP
jgi:hypothetical protein